MGKNSQFKIQQAIQLFLSIYRKELFKATSKNNNLSKETKDAFFDTITNYTLDMEFLEGILSNEDFDSFLDDNPNIKLDYFHEYVFSILKKHMFVDFKNELIKYTPRRNSTDKDVLEFKKIIDQTHDSISNLNRNTLKEEHLISKKINKVFKVVTENVIDAITSYDLNVKMRDNSERDGYVYKFIKEELSDIQNEMNYCRGWFKPNKPPLSAHIEYMENYFWWEKEILKDLSDKKDKKEILKAFIKLYKIKSEKNIDRVIKEIEANEIRTESVLEETKKEYLKMIKRIKKIELNDQYFKDDFQTEKSMFTVKERKQKEVSKNTLK